MNDKIQRLRTAEECEQFARNVETQFPDLAQAARRRAVELKAALHGARTDAEKEALRAVYAYEESLSSKNGRKTRATRTWQMIRKHGVIGAVERAVNRPQETVGLARLRELGMEDFAFEAVVLRYPELFSPEAVRRSKERMRGS